MRAFGLVVAVFLLAASPASAWQEYIYLNQNVAI